MSNLIDRYQEIINNLHNEWGSSGYYYYKNKNTIGIYNKMCSCIDWLNSSISCLRIAQYKSTNNTHSETLAIALELSHFSIVVDSIMELYRAFYDDNLKTYGTLSKNGFFKNTLNSNKETIKNFNLNADNDDKFFKEIRAIFSAHSTNLGSKDFRFYSSWSIIDKDNNGFFYSTYLYSFGDLENKFIVYYDELIDYLYSRLYLLDLISRDIIKIIK